MNSIKKIKYTTEDMEGDLLEIIHQIQKTNWKPNKILGIARGGLVPANYLSQWFNIPMFTYHLSLRDHKRVDAFDSQLINAIENKKILIIDDICDSGETMSKLVEMIEHHRCSAKFACLHYNVGQDNFEPDFYGREINKNEEDAWIVYPWEEWWKA